MIKDMETLGITENDADDRESGEDPLVRTNTLLGRR